LTLNVLNGTIIIVGSECMKKIILFFIAIFILFISPVNASNYQYEYSEDYIQYKLEKEDNSEDEEPNFAFWGMLIVAFLAISVFLIAYKSDDGMPDD
jgi:hypothetical protein